MKLYDFQQKGLEEVKDKNKVAFYWDMGLGKTFMGSEKMIQLGSAVNLIICQKSKVNDWIQHFKNYYAQNEQDFCCDELILDLTDNKQMERFISQEKSAHYFLYPYLVIAVINYELTFRRKQLLELENFTLLLDESSLIQNETAKRSKFINKLKPKNVILLSGTPVNGKYENLYSQLQLLGWKISKDLFWKQYIDWEWVEETDGFFRRKINGYKNVDRLKRRLADFGATFMKSDEVIDLPEQNHNKIWIKPTKEYWQFIKRKIILINDQELIGDTVLTAMLYSRMLCGQYNQDKLEAFKDILDSTQDRLIVFYNFNAELAAMWRIAAAQDRPVSIVNGQVKDLTAYEEHDNSVTFIQYQAGAMGLNLQKANKVIYFTLPLSSELFEQSKKRIHRVGQERRCFYYYLMCSGSIEEKIWQTLEMRKDYTDYLFRKEFEK